MDTEPEELMDVRKMKAIRFIVSLNHEAIVVGAIIAVFFVTAFFLNFFTAVRWLLYMGFAYCLLYGFKKRQTLASWLHRTLDHSLVGGFRKSREEHLEDAGQGQPLYGGIKYNRRINDIKRVRGWDIDPYVDDHSQIFGVGVDKKRKTLTFVAWVYGIQLPNSSPLAIRSFKAGMQQALKDLPFASEAPVEMSFLLQTFKGDDITPEAMVDAGEEFRNQTKPTPQMPALWREHMIETNRDGVTHVTCIMISIKPNKLPRKGKDRPDAYKAAFEAATKYLKVLAGNGQKRSPIGLSGYKFLDYNNMIMLARSVLDPFYARNRLMSGKIPPASEGLMPKKKRRPTYANFRNARYSIIGRGLQRGYYVDDLDAKGVRFNILEELENLPYDKNIVFVLRVPSDKDAQNFSEMASGESQDAIANSRGRAVDVVAAQEADDRAMRVAQRDGQVIFDIYLNVYGRTDSDLDEVDRAVEHLSSPTVLDIQPLDKVHWKALNAALPLCRGLETSRSHPWWVNFLKSNVR